MADGSVKIEVGLNIGKAEKDLAKLKEKINKAEDELNSNSARKTELEKQIAQVGAQADEAKKKVMELKDQLSQTRSRDEKASIRAQLADATEEQRILTRESNRLNDEFVRVNDRIGQGTQNLEDMREEAGELVRQIERARPGEAIASSLESAKRSLAKFLKHAIGIRSVYILFQRLKQSIKSAVQEYAEYDKELKYNLALMSATKKAIQITNGAALASIYNAILPIVQKIANWMLEAANAAAKFIAILSGKSTYKKVVVNTDEVAASIDDVEEEEEEATEEAKELKKQLLGFDELNILSQDNTSSKDKKDKKQKPDLDGIDVIEEAIDEFDDSKVAKLARFIRDHLEEIKTLALAVGAALGTWMLGKLIEKLTGMSIATSKLLGAAMAVGGAIVYVKGFFDAWKNGLDNGNLIEMIEGAAAVIAGLWLAAGSVGAGIGSLVTGLGLATVGFKEWADAGEMPIKTLIAIDAGIALVGFGISLLTGSWIPLAIAAIAGLMFSLPEILGGLSDFFYSLGMDNMGDWFKGMSEKAAYARDWLRTNVVVPVCEYISSAFEEWNTGEHRGDYENDVQWFLHGVLKLPTWDEFITWAEGAVDALWEGFKKGFSKLISDPAISILLDMTVGAPIRMFFQALVGDSEEKGEDIGDGISTGMENNDGTVTSATSTVFGSIIQKFKELLAQREMVDVGENVDAGLEEGIDDEESKNGIFDAVTLLSKKVIDLFKECFDINSPAEETREIGQYVDEGLEKGIEDGTSDVVAAAEDAAEQTTDAFQDGADRTLSIVEKMRADINDVFHGIIEDVADNLQQMRDLMNFEWSIPRPKIPKIEWTYKSVAYGDGQSVSIPEFFVNWYAKGGVFDFPQLIGVGENGKEAVVPLEKNTEWMQTVAEGLIERMSQSRFMNDLASAFASTLLPAMAGGGIVPPNAVSGGGISRDDMQMAIERGVYNAIMALGGMPRSRGDIHMDVNGREFARATYSDYKAVENEHGISLIES